MRANVKASTLLRDLTRALDLADDMVGSMHPAHWRTERARIARLRAELPAMVKRGEKS